MVWYIYGKNNALKVSKMPTCLASKTTCHVDRMSGNCVPYKQCCALKLVMCIVKEYRPNQLSSTCLVFELPKALIYRSYSLTGGRSSRSKLAISSSIIFNKSFPLCIVLLEVFLLTARCLAETKLIAVRGRSRRGW